MNCIVYVSFLIVFLLKRDDLFNSNSGLDGNSDGILSIIPCIADFLRHILGDGGEIEIGLLVSSFVHEGKSIILIDIDDFPVIAFNDRNGGSVGGRDHIFEFLSGENISGEEVAFGVAVLSGLGNRNRNNLAWLSLDHHEAAVETSEPKRKKKTRRSYVKRFLLETNHEVTFAIAHR